MKRTLICLILISLCGCGPRDYAIEPWEVYDEPPAVILTADEQGLYDAISGQLTPAAQKFAATLSESERAAIARLQPGAKAVLEKIVRQKNAYRATVQTHNKKARELFQTQCKKVLNVKDDQLTKLMGN